jgi:hypothetical protein
MKKLFILSFILILFSLAAPAQRIWDRRPNTPLSLINRNTRLIASQQYRIEKFRLQVARERILRDGVITPKEKKRLKRIRRHQKTIRERHYPLLS